MNIKRLLYGPYSMYIISVILGLGLATIFRKACNKRNCIIHKAVPINIINKKIFKYNDKCYRFKASAVTCDKDKQILDIA